MSFKTVMYVLLILVFIFLVWQYVLPTTGNFSISSGSAETVSTPNEAMIRGLKASFGTWVVQDTGEFEFHKGEKYSQETLGMGGLFGKIKFFCSKNLSAYCVGNPDEAAIRENFTARVTAYCPFQERSKYCCIGIGYVPTKIADV